jgi:glycosyltransferase involved in cell wall biosynthesis
MPNVMGSDDGAPCAHARAQTDGPRVLHAIPTGLGRGAQIFARALVDQLGGLGGGHRLVSLFDGEGEVEVDDTMGLPGGPRAASGLHPGAVTALATRLRRFEHDVVVAHGGDAFKYLALSSRSPVVYCVIGTWPSGARRSSRRLAWTALARRAWMVAPVSEEVAQDCRDVLSLRSDRIRVIPNGRDDSRFVPAPRPTVGPVTLLFVGHLTAGKRPQSFVHLIELLRADGYPVCGQIVGAGPMESELRRHAARAGVELLGWTRDVVPHMQSADVFVFPSAPDGEGMPGVLIEAGLCGLPAVSTRVAGASAVIDDGQTGLLVDVDDLDGLVRAAAELVEHPRRRLAMGAAARRRCEEDFSLGVVAARWDKLLRTAPTRRRRAGVGAPSPAAR